MLWALLLSAGLPLAHGQEAAWPSLSEGLPAQSRELKRDAALIVGIDDYLFVGEVPGAVENAKDWRRYLAQRGIPLQQMRFLADRYATKEGIEAAAAEVSTLVKPGGTVWLVYIGHGAPVAVKHKGEVKADGLLVGVDAQGSASSLEARSVRHTELMKLLSGHGGPTVAVLDACFSGKSQSDEMLAEGLMGIGLTSMLEAPEVTILSAGRSDQFAGPLPGLGRPAFSYLALGALLGWGDANGDGSVSAQEAVSYAGGALSALVVDRQQQPELSGDNLSLGVASGFAGPNLLDMAEAVTGGVTGPSGGQVSGGGFEPIQLDITQALQEQKCSEKAKSGALAARSSTLSQAVAARQKEATSTWSALKPQLVACLELEDRSPCVAAAESWLSNARGLRVEVSAGQHVEATACGDRSYAYEGVSSQVSVAEIPDAEEMSARLQSLVDMVRIPGGTYTIGSPSSESYRWGDENQVRVTLSSFWMMKHEVTQEEYEAVMGTNPSTFSGCSNCPVEGVSWYDAVAYANALSERERLTPAYSISGESVQWNRSANGYRLPTEAEWEVAARGGQSYRYAGSDEADAVGWYYSNSGDKTHPVCGKQKNGYGLCDMSGNVWEWTWNWYARAHSGGTNPIGPASGSERVLRGGNWGFSTRYLRVASRAPNSPSSRSSQGFRLSRTIP